MNNWLEMRNAFEQLAWLVVGVSIGLYLINKAISDAKDRYYWIGRKDGWDMHRRMIDNKVKTDEVFDYDKN
jgi:hypothetical protein